MATLIWPEKFSQTSSSVDMINSHKRVISELVNGRDWAIQLQTLLRKDSRNSSAALTQEMAEKVLRSFTESIYLLGSMESGEVCDDGGSEDSGASKRRSSDSGSKEGRGCYKRRKGAQTWTEVATTIEDNYAWRKYGQKAILNAKFPRCYFRCTHKHEQGCRATKQVQRMEDDSNMYRITYLGVHTCKRNNKLSPQIIKDTDPWELWDNNLKPQMSNIIDHHTVNVPTSVKQEYFKQDTPSDVTDNSSSPLGSVFEREPVALVDHIDHDFGSLDMDEFMANCVGLDASDFHVFDEIGISL